MGRVYLPNTSIFPEELGGRVRDSNFNQSQKNCNKTKKKKIKKGTKADDTKIATQSSLINSAQGAQYSVILAT